MSTHGEFLNIIYVDEVCRMFLFVLHLSVSPLRELPKPRSTPNTLTPLLHTSLQRVCFGNFHVPKTILPTKSITLAPKEKYCALSAMTKWNMFEANHVFPRVRNYAICSRNMFLMCLASVTPCDCNFHCLLEFMISEATAWTHLMGRFWNVKPGGIHWATSFCSPFQASLAHRRVPGVWGILGD